MYPEPSLSKTENASMMSSFESTALTFFVMMFRKELKSMAFGFTFAAAHISLSSVAETSWPMLRSTVPRPAMLSTGAALATSWNAIWNSSRDSGSISAADMMI
eukprot:Amastigsp_a176283_338.p3 type:complete len:103 gc:universal Amastigsp_a176283_338:330-22(-)